MSQRPFSRRAAPRTNHPQPRKAIPRGQLASLTLAGLGVVYGDIGTSPLYAMRESFHAGGGIDVTPSNVFGVTSLILWSLILVVSVKYVGFVLRADNRGEGGILALVALIRPSPTSRGGAAVILGGILGTALLYGDGMITPAISVLSATEGFAIAAPATARFVTTAAVVIIVGLFMVQPRGTGSIGRAFGPIMLAWFSVLAILGVQAIAGEPQILQALLPHHAVSFFLDHQVRAFLVLGAVFLVVTGSEALYADMGHFGRRPITLAWFALVLPALALNYAGQGASLIADPARIESPFYTMAAEWTRFPLAMLATVATVVASQALITGAFSLTVQAIQLDYLPRMRVIHTSAETRGQVYVPLVNWLLMVACVGLVLGFGSSSSLAAAYGVAVTLTMAITTTLLLLVMRGRWGWSWLAAGGLTALFLAIDASYLGANLLKIPHGGWFPLVVAGLLCLAMTTWRRGRALVAARLRAVEVPVQAFLAEQVGPGTIRTPGVSVYLHRHPLVVPPALLASFDSTRSLARHVILLAVLTEERARVLPAQRAEVTQLGQEFHQVVLRYGFMERPDVATALELLRGEGIGFVPEVATYFISKESVRSVEGGGMAPWREALFTVMYRNAWSSAEYLQLPTERVIEVGRTVEI